MTETILDHGYIPEEHAPDPVIGHGDPTSPGKIGIWLFLASEIMFFIAILGSYIIFRSGQPGLFSKHAFILSKPLAGLNTVVLIFSSLTMALAVDASQKGDRRKTTLCLALTIACALAFMGSRPRSTTTSGSTTRSSPRTPPRPPASSTSSTATSRTGAKTSWN